jgi:hypothetical protein
VELGPRLMPRACDCDLSALPGDVSMVRAL